MTQSMYVKEESIKELRIQLEYLTSELNKITSHIQLLEIPDELVGNSDIEPENEISELLRKQNVISHEIIAVKKRIHRLSAKTILKVELLILPIVVVLLIFVTINYAIMPTELATLKSRISIEDLRGDTSSDYNYWNLLNQKPLTVNIENNAKLSDQKIQNVKDAIVSMDTVKDNSFAYDSTNDNKSHFKGWQGALATVSNTKHSIPQKFDIIQTSNGNGEVVISLSTMKDDQGYSGFTRILTDGNQIRKVFITIYDAEGLTSGQLESIVRHDFGQALGLPLIDKSDDLMHESFMNHSDISTCDVKYLQKLYNDEKPSNDFCDG